MYLGPDSSLPPFSRRPHSLSCPDKCSGANGGGGQQPGGAAPGINLPADYLYSGKNTLGFLGPGSVALGGQASGGTMLQRDKRTSLSQSRVARRRKPQAWEGLVFDSEINCIAQDIP